MSPNPASENPFLQLVLNRTETALRRLQETIWETGPNLSATACAPAPEPIGWEQVAQLPFHNCSFPLRWGKLCAFRWYRVEIPADVLREYPYLSWRDQAQTTAWLDGCPYFGFDPFHRQVRLPEGAQTVWLESVCLPPTMLGNLHPTPEGLLCEGPRLLRRNDEPWAAWQKLSLLFELATEERMELHPEMGRRMKPFGYQPVLASASPLYRRILRWLDRCLNAYETRGPEALNTALEAAFHDLRAGDGFRLKAILSGHAHVDLVWLWPERVGEFKARHSFANALRLLEIYPEFRFQYSQSASYAAVEKSAPRLFEKVLSATAAGQWEMSGALEVESDTLLPCGEALGRSFVLGQKRFAQWTGRPSPLLWLPDVFGYSGCLPQLMQACGVEYFFTTKLSWNSINPFPYSSFQWRGVDGSVVLAHLTQDIGYNNSMRVTELRTAERSYRQADVHNEFLVPTGYGDGGGGPTEEMCEKARQAARLAGLPHTEWDSPIAFFERLARDQAVLPVYEGELYFENHRGTYTTHGWLKLALRQAESALQRWEAAHVALGLGPIPQQPWERVVFAQFHDYIPGSSVPSVYREAKRDLEKVVADAETALRALSADAGDSSAFWFNPLPLPRLYNLPDQRLLRLPPLGSADESVAESIAPTEQTPHALKNEKLEATFTAEGQLASLTAEGRVVPWQKPGVEFWVYRDFPALHESWDIDRQALDTGERLTGPVQVTHGHTATGAGWVRFEMTFSRSRLAWTYHLEPGQSLLELRVSLDWQEPHCLLRLALPTDYQGRMVRYGAPFGSTLRSQARGSTETEARWEVPGSRYAIVTDDAGSEGLFLITEAKYGFSCFDGCLTVSLLRSPLHTGAEGEDYAYMCPQTLTEDGANPRHTDFGPQEIRLGLGVFHPELAPHQQPAALADCYFAAPIKTPQPLTAPGWKGLTSGPSLIPVWAQPLDSRSWLLRLHEVLGRRGRFHILLEDGWTVAPCQFDGTDLPDTSESPDQDYRPYEIISLKFRRT